MKVYQYNQRIQYWYDRSVRSWYCCTNDIEGRLVNDDDICPASRAWYTKEQILEECKDLETEIRYETKKVEKGSDK